MQSVYWEYEIDINSLTTGSFVSSIGRVDRLGLAYEAYVYVNGKKYRLAEMFDCAEVAEKAVERTWEREANKTRGTNLCRK